MVERCFIMHRCYHSVCFSLCCWKQTNFGLKHTKSFKKTLFLILSEFCSNWSAFMLLSLRCVCARGLSKQPDNVHRYNPLSCYSFSSEVCRVLYEVLRGAAVNKLVGKLSTAKILHEIASIQSVVCFRSQRETEVESGSVVAPVTSVACVWVTARYSGINCWTSAERYETNKPKSEQQKLNWCYWAGGALHEVTDRVRKDRRRHGDLQGTS